MKIDRVVFRCDRETSDWDGSNQKDWFGEDSYSLGETLHGSICDVITYREKHNNLFVQVYAGGKLFCEIPIHSVTRVYYA